MAKELTRREFVQTAGAGAAALAWLGAGQRRRCSLPRLASRPCWVANPCMREVGPAGLSGASPGSRRCWRCCAADDGPVPAVAGRWRISSGLRGAARRQTVRGDGQRHDGADHRPVRDGRGRRRRSHYLPLHVHCHLQRDSDAQSLAGVRGHGSGHADDGPGFDRKPDHRANARHRAGAYLRSAVRYGPDQRHRQEAQSGRRGRRLSGVAGGIQGLASAARWAIWAASVSRTPSTFLLAKGAPSRATARSCWTTAVPSTTAAARLGPFRAAAASVAAATSGCSIFRRPCCCSRLTSW